MSKPVSLTVHKNQRARRHGKELRNQIQACVGQAQREFRTDWAGYALVTWDSKGYSFANWDGIGPLGAFPVEEFARNILARARAKRDASDLIAPNDDVD